MQYKSVAGPIGLKVHSGVSYEEAVNQYARIINREAVNGWKLYWIQQIPVTKSSPNIVGVLGLAAFAGFCGFLLGDTGGAVVGAIVGGILGFFVAREEKPELFNMLIFSNEEGVATSSVAANSSSPSSSNPSAPKPTLSQIAQRARTDGFWNCSGCDEKNLSTSRFCKGCGKHK